MEKMKSVLIIEADDEDDENELMNNNELASTSKNVNDFERKNIIQTIYEYKLNEVLHRNKFDLNTEKMKHIGPLRKKIRSEIKAIFEQYSSEQENEAWNRALIRIRSARKKQKRLFIFNMKK